MSKQEKVMLWFAGMSLFGGASIGAQLAFTPTMRMVVLGAGLVAFIICDVGLSAAHRSEL